MNNIDENIFESMSYKINSLKDELSIVRDDYEDLRTEVIHFFMNTKNGDMDIEECVEEFQMGLLDFCHIDVNYLLEDMNNDI